METTFRNQAQAQNPFQLTSDPVHSSNSSNKQRPYSNVNHKQNKQEVEYSSEVNNSFDHNERPHRSQESRTHDNNRDASDDYDDMNVSFANQEEGASSDGEENHRGREVDHKYQQRTDGSRSVESSPDEKNEEGDEDLMKEIRTLKSDLSHPKEIQTANFRQTPKKNQNSSPQNYMQNFGDFSPNRVTTEDEFKEYYEKFCIAFLKKKEEELLRKRKEKADQELAELQDKPTLISKPNSRKYIPLMDRTPLLDARRAREIEKIRQERDEKLQKELDELTFKPKINERSRSICSPKKDNGTRSKSQIRDVSPVANAKFNEELFKPKINYNSQQIAKGIREKSSDDVVDRLYLHADQGNTKKEELKKQLTPNFTPALNRKSQRIAKQIEDQKHDASQYESEASKYRSNSRTRQDGDADLLALEHASDADLLEILKQFNLMLKEKNESPINLEQLSSLMANYADKRREQSKEDANTEEEDEEEEDDEVDQVPCFANNAARRCETEPSPQISEKPLSAGKKISIAKEEDDQNLAKIEQNLQKLQEKLQTSNRQATPNKTSPRKQATNEKKAEEADVKKGSQSPKKNGTLMSNLIKNPRTHNKSDDPPITPISEDLKLQALGFAGKKPSPSKKATGKETGKEAAKSARDYSPLLTSQKSKEKYGDITPRGAKATTKSSQKTLGSAPQKTSGTKGDKTKVKKGTKKGKKAKKDDNPEKRLDTEQSEKKSKKAQETNSELSSQAFATIGSKSGLEGWRSPPQEVQDGVDEEVFLTQEDEEKEFHHGANPHHNTSDHEESRVRNHFGEQTFGTDELEDKYSKEEINRSKDDDSFASRKSRKSHKSKVNSELNNEASQVNSSLNKAIRSHRESEAEGERSNTSQEQYNEVEREVLIEREAPQTEKTKAHGVVRSRHGSEYSRSQMSKAVLEEEEEDEQSSGEEVQKEEGHNTGRSTGQAGSKNKIKSQKSSMNQIEDDVKSQKSGSQRDGGVNASKRNNKSIFSAQNNKEERPSVHVNHVNHVNHVTENVHQPSRQNVNNTESKVEESFYSDEESQSQSQSTIRDGLHSRKEGNLSFSNNKNKKGSFDDQNTSLSTNKHQKKEEMHRGAPADYASAGSEQARHGAVDYASVGSEHVRHAPAEYSSQAGSEQVRRAVPAEYSSQGGSEHARRATTEQASLQAGSGSEHARRAHGEYPSSQNSDYIRHLPAEYSSQGGSEHPKRAGIEYSSQAGSEHSRQIPSKTFESEQARHSRKNAPPRFEVMNTETIQIQPPSQVVKKTKYAMDGTGKNLASASSRGLKAMAEHIVKKFKNYDAEVKQNKKEYRVSVSRSESRSRSPETHPEPAPVKKVAQVPSFKTPEKRDLSANKFENERRDVSAQKKARSSVLHALTPEKFETVGGKKSTHLKRHSVAVPMKGFSGKREF